MVRISRTLLREKKNLLLVDREENKTRLEASLSCWGRSSARGSLPLPRGKSSQIGGGGALSSLPGMRSLDFSQD